MSAVLKEGAIPVEAKALALRAEGAMAMAETYECATREQFLMGSDSLRSLATLKKALEEKRTSVTGPLNEALKTINDWFRGPAATVQQAIDVYKRQMGAFEAREQAELRRQADEAARRAREEREELERRALFALDKGQTEKAETLLARSEAVVPAKPDLAPVKAAGMGFGEAWEFEVIDAALIPREFLKVDEAKIGQYVRAMKASAKIAGVRVFSRPKVSVRAK